MQASTVTYTGLVQGVGFRATVGRIANQLGVTGWVRNNEDGTVTAHAEGTDAQIADLRERIRTSGIGRSDDEIENPHAKPEKAASFRIVH